MKIKNIFIVGILFLALLAYIVSFEIPKAERKETERKPLHAIAKAQIASLEIKKGSETIKLLNSNPQKEVAKSKLDEQQARLMDAVAPNEWSIEGLAYPQVDSANLNAIITQLFAYELGEPLPATELESDLALYGLTAPEVTLSTERFDQYGSSKKIRFEFGKRSDFLAKRYVRYTRVDGSSDIFLTDDLLFFATNKPLKDFRRKDPIVFSDNEISKLELSTSGSYAKLALEKKPSKVPGTSGDVWNLYDPVVSSADQSKVSELLRNIKSLKAKDYLEGDSAKAKEPLFDHSSLTALLYNKNEQSNPLKIQIASEQDGENEKTYFSISSTKAIFEAESNTTAEALKDPYSYRQTKYFEIDVDDVQSFDLSGSWVLPLKGEKKDQKWTVGDKPGDDSFIRQWLMDIKDLKAKSFPTESKDFGFSNPSYKLTLKVGDTLSGVDAKAIERVLVIGLPEATQDGKPKTFFAAVDDLSEPFIIASEDLEKISPKAETLLAIPTPVPTIIATKVPQITP